MNKNKSIESNIIFLISLPLPVKSWMVKKICFVELLVIFTLDKKEKMEIFNFPDDLIKIG